MSEPRIRIHIAGSTVFKLLLLSAVVAVSVAFMWYTYAVIGQLREEAQAKVRSYVRLWVRAVDQDTPSAETQLIFDEIISQANFPIIVASAEREPNFWRNLSGLADNDRTPKALEKVRQIMREMKEETGEVEIVFGAVGTEEGGDLRRGVNYFYHGDSELIESLEIAPYIQIGMVLSILSIGFVGYTNIKRSDERHIWVGMAKETAHQLGAPISALMGWLEIMRGRLAQNPSLLASESHADSSPDVREILDAMDTDVRRLEQVANRFSKIGSAPEMKLCDINEPLRETVEYYSRRLPFGGRGIKLDLTTGAVPRVTLNPQLFCWTIENLIKNAMEAVNSRTGVITVDSSLSPDGRCVLVTISDNGRGIPLGMQRRIFRPGFTSKKRGWGLGLTLARRIIDEYHRGKLTLLRSSPGETIFQLSLPLAGRKDCQDRQNRQNKEGKT